MTSTPANFNMIPSMTRRSLKMEQCESREYVMALVQLEN